MSLRRRIMGYLGRRRMRYQTYQPDAGSTTQVEVIANGIANLVEADGVQVIAGTS